MSIQRQQYIKLDECIYAYIDEAELPPHKYMKLFNIAFRAMTELGLDFFYAIKSKKLPINSNMTVNLPPDYLQYSKIGVLNANGELVPLLYNNKLTTYADLLPDRVNKVQDNQIWDINFNLNTWYNYYFDGAYTNLYGVPSGAPFIGSFKIDNDNGVIVLDPNFAYEYIVIEYMASPQEGTDYYVPIHFKEAIISYLRWKDIASLPISRKGNLGDKAQRRSEYYNDRRLALARWKPFSIHEAYQASLEQTRLAVKV